MYLCCAHVTLVKHVIVIHTHCWACIWMLLVCVCVCVCVHGSGSWLMCCSVLVSIHASNQTTTQTHWKVKTLHPSHCPPVCMSVCVPCTALYSGVFYPSATLSFHSALPACPPVLTHIYTQHSEHTHTAILVGFLPPCLICMENYYTHSDFCHFWMLKAF